jgi:hypothetical protein
MATPVPPWCDAPLPCARRAAAAAAAAPGCCPPTPPPHSARVFGGGEGGQGMEAIRREPSEVQKTSQEVGIRR